MLIRSKRQKNSSILPSMDREILKYLHGFYDKGDYVGFHSLTPLFEKFNKGEDFSYFVQRLRTILGHLAILNLIELDNTEYGSWGTAKEETILFDYTHLPVKGRITPEGVINIERVVLSDRQKDIDSSILITNKLTRTNIYATILFGIIVTSLQIRSCVKERYQGQQITNRLNLDSLRLLQQAKHDSMLEKALLHIYEGRSDSSKNFSKPSRTVPVKKN